jgi:hypothetical protein
MEGRTEMRKLFFAIKTAVIISLTTAVYCDSGKKEVRFLFKFKPGLTREYRNLVKTTATITEGNKPVKKENYSRQSRVLEQVIAVLDSSKARVSLSSIYDAPEAASASPSDSGASKPRVWSIEYLTAANGKILEFFPHDSTEREMVEAYKNYYEQAAPVFPDQPVGEGYSWSQTTRLIVKEEGTTNVETRYKVRSFVREAGYDCAVIDFEGDMVLPFRSTKSDETLVVGLEKIKAKGVIYFGYLIGTIIKQEETYDFRSEGECIKNGKSEKYVSTGQVMHTIVLTDAGI